MYGISFLQYYGEVVSIVCCRKGRSCWNQIGITVLASLSSKELQLLEAHNFYSYQIMTQTTTMKPLSSYSIDEVAIWISCIGLSDKSVPFRDNAIDGGMLVTLTFEDLTGDLGLTALQAKKVQRSIEFTLGLVAYTNSGRVATTSND